MGPNRYTPLAQSSLPPPKRPPNFRRRLDAWMAILLVIFGLFTVRLFYLQIIKHDYYAQQAANDQQKEYVIPAERGIIEAHSGSSIIPVALNEKLYTIYADPTLIKNDSTTDASKLVAILGGKASVYAKALTTPNTRYVVLAKRISSKQQNAVLNLKLPGIGSQAVNYRLYPQGSLAAQVLGFVNDEGQGNYGIEQYLNKQLAGQPGRLKAVTDINGVPLASGKDNVQIDPVAGQSVVLTLDMPMQEQLEKLLKQGLDNAHSSSGSALIMDPYSGAVKAMANWPSYDPAQYFKVKDYSVFGNAAVSSPLEVGSVMKVLTVAAGLNMGAIKANSSFYDPAIWHIDGHDVKDVAIDGGPQTRTVQDILQYSLNTGATWVLMQMGGGQINQQARDRWHDYLVNHYGFSKPTGIEQNNEAGGYVPSPRSGYGLNLTYANTTFGQAMTATPIQMGAALSSVINGGTYYQPYLVDGWLKSDGSVQKKSPVVVRQHVVAPSVGRTLRSIMEFMVKHHFFAQPFSNRYSVGGKTGTPQIANPAGGYYTDRFNGTYIGYVGGRQPQYVIIVRVNEPHIGGFGGSGAAQPIFGTIAHMLIDNFNVLPK